MIYFDHTNHIRLWDWLSKNPDKNKFNWPQWKYNIGNIDHVENSCFSCEYTNYIDPDDEHSCNGCPLVWPSGVCYSGGLYTKWILAKDDLDERIKIAKEIRDLPVKDGIVCI